jgi:hypothetical protein
MNYNQAVSLVLHDPFTVSVMAFVLLCCLTGFISEKYIRNEK